MTILLPAMSELFQAVIASEEKTDLRQFVSDWRVLGNKYLLRNDIVNAFTAYCTKYEKPEQFHQSSHLSKLIYYVQEIFSKITAFASCCDQKLLV